jgi:hypothetical protein
MKNRSKGLVAVILSVFMALYALPLAWAADGAQPAQAEASSNSASMPAEPSEGGRVSYFDDAVVNELVDAAAKEDSSNAYGLVLLTREQMDLWERADGLEFVIYYATEDGVTFSDEVIMNVACAYYAENETEIYGMQRLYPSISESGEYENYIYSTATAEGYAEFQISDAVLTELSKRFVEIPLEERESAFGEWFEMAKDPESLQEFEKSLE